MYTQIILLLQSSVTHSSKDSQDNNVGPGSAAMDMDNNSAMGAAVGVPYRVSSAYTVPCLQSSGTNNIGEGEEKHDGGPTDGQPSLSHICIPGLLCLL
jgi:hypothetical protein